MYWGCQRIGCQGCLAPFRGKCLFQQNSLGRFHCWACLLLGNFFKHGSLVLLPLAFWVYFFIFSCVGCVQHEKKPMTHGKSVAKYVSNFRASRWVTVMLKFSLPFLSYFRAQFDRQVPGWSAQQQLLWIRGAPGKTDSLDILFFFHFDTFPQATVAVNNAKCQWEKPTFTYLVCSCSSSRTTCPREGSHGKIYAKRLCRTSSRENIILQVNLLVWSSGSSTCSKGGRTKALPLTKVTSVSWICPCQIVASLEVPSCASAVACEL